MIATNGAVRKATPTAEPPNDYEAAQRADHSKKKNRAIDATSWRRAFFGLLCLAIMLMIVLAVAMLKYQHEVFIFRDGPGGLSYAGEPAQELTPTNGEIAEQLGLFVEAYRDVPADDATVDRNVLRMLSMVADEQPMNARTQLLNFLLQRANNPKELRKKFTRIVRPLTQAIHDPGTNNWRMTWIEDTTTAGKSVPSFHQGVISILPDPTLPTDESRRLLDAAGVTIVQFELH